MFPNTTHRLVHLPRNPPPKPEADLPRGECRYIHREAGASQRERCICQGFSLDKQQLVGTSCECGHPAWVHVQQPMAVVTYEEHSAVVDELRRFKQEQERKLQNVQNELVKTQHELMAQRAQSLERERLFKLLEARLYQNMKNLKIELDDKMDGMIDQQHAFQRKLIDVEDTTMEHELKFERLELGKEGGRKTRDLTPVPEASPDDHSMDTIVEDPPTPEKVTRPWGVKVIIVPRRGQQFAFDPDSKGYGRCQSRGLHKDLQLSDRDSATFHLTIDKTFSAALKGRPWVPLVGYRAHNDHMGRIALRQLPPELSSGDLWDYFFLDHHCVAHDKMQGDLLYIALRDNDLTWPEIKALPPILGSNEAAWSYDIELDGPLPQQQQQQQQQQANGIRHLDKADLMYEYSPSPPPYTSQRNTLQAEGLTENRLATPLGVLATASASVLGHALSRQPTAQSATAQSLRSLGSTEDGSDDEHSHRDKIRKLRPKRSEPAMHHGSHHGHSNSGGSSHGSGSQPTVYYSGRSKRKMPVREKTKEPLQFRLPSLLHHRNKEEAA